MATYTIQKGDTLTAIAKRLSGVTGPGIYGYVQALTQMNAIQNPNRIFAGQVLTYPDEWTQGPTTKRRPMTIDITPQYERPVNAAPTIPRRAPLFPPGQPFWKNPLILGAAAIAALLFFTRR